MSSNFSFLQKYWPDFAKTMEFAESYVYTDPASSKNKSGLFIELMVREILRIEGLREPEFDNTHYTRIKLLKSEGLLPGNVNDWIHQVRKSRNDSTHGNIASEQEALSVLSFTYYIAVWFMKTYGDGNNIEYQKFMPPERPKYKPDYTILVQNQERIIDEQSEVIANKEADLAEANAQLAERDKILAEQAAQIEKLIKERENLKIVTPQSQLSKDERQKASAIAIADTKLTEADTRKIIDEKLRKVGWEVDTENLRYSKGTRPAKGRNLAIAEWPMKSTKNKDNRVDYALFVGEQLIGIIEAKAYEKSVYAIVDNQCREYSRNVKDEDDKYCLGKWQGYKIPFAFATNGRPYLKQIETESGIWFIDFRKDSNIPIALHGWYSPSELFAKFKQNVDEADMKLINLPFDFLRDPDGLNLRHYQLSAVQAVENAVINEQKRILLAMATGTGKTRTILGMIYRFLKTNRFRRILFLVDRTALGEQAQDVFNDVKLEDLQSLNKIYNINTLDDIDLAVETRIQVATVQGMVARILNDDKEKTPSSGDFDCIIIDEAHRGYNLDRDLSDAELLYRDQNDFISKYKKVIDYFDAVKIGLTATPTLHTKIIFGEPVFTYSYREAVIDGYLVDYDVPYIIKTKLNQSKIHHDKGEKLARYNPVTKELLNPSELEDEVDFEVEDFNKKVLTPSFNEEVLKKLSEYIDPEGEEKTLIFAVNDRHADDIVRYLRDIYKNQDVPFDAIKKITCSIGDKTRVQNAIKLFKNEHYPTIVVTVDLLSTGVDVPEVTKIVFMRRVKSRTLYEQMIGRATRLCPKIKKDHFDIFDAVDLYSYLNKVSSMKPVVTNPKETFDKLFAGYEKLEDEEHIKFINEQIIAKFNRSKIRLNEVKQKYFAEKVGCESISNFVLEARKKAKISATECKNFLLENKEAFDVFKMPDERSDNDKYILISNKKDKVCEIARGYGKNQKPEDYLESFSNYLKENRNKIEAIETICTHPKDLTAKDLKELRIKLDLEGFNELQLNTATKVVTKEECVADIIGFIRCYAIGCSLVSHEDRIHNAVKKLCKAHDFTAGEKKWIDRIEKYLINESVVNVQTFDEEPAWKIQGGFAKINKVFGNKLTEIIKELNTYLYEDKIA